MNTKNSPLEGLSKREKVALFYLFQDRKIKIKDLAGKIFLAESTTRSVLTSIYQRLNISGSDQEKRDNLFHRYSRKFKELYPTLDAIEDEKFEEEEYEEEEPIPVTYPFVPRQTTDEDEPIVDIPPATPPVPPDTDIWGGRPPRQPQPAQPIQQPRPRITTAAIIAIVGAAGVCLVGVCLVVWVLNNINNPTAINANSPTTQPTDPIVFPPTDTEELPSIPTRTFPPSPTDTQLPVFLDEQIPPPGTIQRAGESFTKNGLVVYMKDEMGIASKGREGDFFVFEFVLVNMRDKPYIAHLKYTTYHLKDNVGNDYRAMSDCETAPVDIDYTETISAGSTHRWNFHGYGCIRYEGKLDPSATKLIFSMEEFAGMTDLGWEYDLR